MQPKTFACFLALLLLCFSCKKEAGPKGEQGRQGETGQPGEPGVDGYTSLILLTPISSNAACPNGGTLVESGIDKNKNNTLDSNEIDNSQSICNGSNAQSDKQILIPIPNSGAISNSTTPIITGTLIKFNKTYYSGVDSIIFVASPYVYGGANTSVVELYNITDATPVTGGSLSSDYSGANPPFIQTGNIYNNLPDKEIAIGVRSYSANEGVYAGTGFCYLFLYRN